ncbi:MAG: hypothetical protein ABSE86_37880 [Bryobacteraceae bacterium]
MDTGFETLWSATSPSTRAQLTTDYVTAWFAEVSSFTVAQYYNGKDGNGRPWASATEDVTQDNFLSEFGGQITFVLPRLRYIGVDPNLTYQISDWAATLWPAGNWTLNNSAICTGLSKCSSDRCTAGTSVKAGTVDKFEQTAWAASENYSKDAAHHFMLPQVHTSKSTVSDFAQVVAIRTTLSFGRQRQFHSLPASL